jgi:hypothetical protein
VPALGFDGTITEADVAEIIAQLTHPAVTAGAWRVTPVTNQRAVTVTGGKGGAAFILADVASAVLQLAPPVTARYDLVALRLDWKANTAAFVVVQGPSSTPAIPTKPLPLTSFVSARKPGELLDIPLAVTWVDSSNVVRVFDVRTLPPTGRGHLLNRIPVEWGGDTATLDISPRMLADILVPYPGMPFRLTVDATCQVGGPNRGNRWDFQAGVGYRDATATFFNPLRELLTYSRGFDQFDSNVTQQRVSMGVPSDRIFYAETRVGVQAAYVPGQGQGFQQGLILKDLREFHIGVWAA